jgi:effector-binding domain-containing protein
MGHLIPRRAVLTILGGSLVLVPLAGSAQDAAPVPDKPAPGQVVPAPDPMDEPSADASNAEELTLTPRPVIYLESNALWDDNFATMTESFDALKKQLETLSLSAGGSPLALYLDTDDAGFKFQAMLPLAGPAPATPPTEARMKFGMSPAGKAIRFAHQGAFDDLDSLYEAITGYLDEKQLTMKTPYIEEYLSPLTSSADPMFKLNIYVLLDETKPPPPEETPEPPLPIDPNLPTGTPAPAVPDPAPVPDSKPVTPVPQPPPSAG